MIFGTKCATQEGGMYAGRLRLPTIHLFLFISSFPQDSMMITTLMIRPTDGRERPRPLVKAFTMPARGAKTHCGLDYVGPAAAGRACHRFAVARRTVAVCSGSARIGPSGK